MRQLGIMILAALATGWGGSAWAPPREIASGEEGLAALDGFLRSGGLHPGERVLGMVGFYGEPLPPQWLFLAGDPERLGGLREFVYARGRLLSQREFVAPKGQDLPHLPLEKGRLKITADRAFGIAEVRAREARVAFASVHYQLRVREAETEPVWLLSLVNRAQVGVGVVYVSAETGEVIRENWTHPGGKGRRETPSSGISSR